MSSPAFCEFCRSYAAAIVLDAEAKPLGFVRNRHANFLWTGVSVSIEDRLLRAKILAWCIMALTGYAPAMSFRGKGRMARDRGLEELLGENLAGTPGLTQKAMFGGLAWLVNGNLLCGASDGGMLVRLGKDNDAWALKIPGVALMVMQGRKMNGWVRAAPHVYGDDALRRKLLKAALEFNRTLPKK